jgi:hypothetical protein
MALQARVTRRLYFWRRVTVEAYCTQHVELVKNPYVGCGHCHEQRSGPSAFDLPVSGA